MKVFTTICVDEPAPGVKAIFSFVAPDQKSGKVFLSSVCDSLNFLSPFCSLELVKFLFDQSFFWMVSSRTWIEFWSSNDLVIRLWQVELQYLHEYAGISTSLGLTAKPLVNFSGVVGNHQTAFGTDISFDTATGNFTKCNAGASFTTPDLIASLIL